MSTISVIKTNLELVHAHEERELAHDWDGTLATMIDDEPFYELYPFGIRVRGREAIKEYWVRMFALPEFIPTLTAAARNEWCTETSAVQLIEWEVKQTDGTTLLSRAWSLFTFRDGLIESERIYSDEIAERLLKPVFDEEFMNHPGVERISS